ncbi:hypothetical protein LCGC14_2866640 [marine sediment metagenome]|uniref:Fibronectin type-III domain-containing protein n=1 Tax=marine sediment metagenome TaxID=412755 RepID=A0A0F8Y3Z3_9ZZZZ
MNKWTMIALIVSAVLLLGGCAGHGSPTPVDQTLTWDNYTDPDGIGFFLYWAPEAESPRQYTDTRKVDLGRPFPEHIIVKDFMPARGSLCFKLTAYDAAGNESDWSEPDVCGFFGLSAVDNLRIE